jgi:hypothetical protein
VATNATAIRGVSRVMTTNQLIWGLIALIAVQDVVLGLVWLKL